MIADKIDISDIEILFIDSSIINNSNGSEYVEMTPFRRKYTDPKHKKL